MAMIEAEMAAAAMGWGRGANAVAVKTAPPGNPDKTAAPRMDSGVLKGISPETRRKVRIFSLLHNSLTDRSMNCKSSQR